MVLWVLQYSTKLYWCELGIAGNNNNKKEFVSVKNYTLEKGGTVKLFYPRDF